MGTYHTFNPPSVDKALTDLVNSKKSLKQYVAQQSGDSQGVRHENWPSFSLKDMIERKDQINPDHVRAVADGWKSLHDAWVNNLNSYRTAIVKAVSGNWEGEAGPAAQAAVTQFVDSIYDSVTESTLDMERRMRGLSETLANMKNGFPAEQDATFSDEDLNGYALQDLLKYYNRTVFQTGRYETYNGSSEKQWAFDTRITGGGDQAFAEFQVKLDAVYKAAEEARRRLQTGYSDALDDASSNLPAFAPVAPPSPREGPQGGPQPGPGGGGGGDGGGGGNPGGSTLSLIHISEPTRPY